MKNYFILKSNSYDFQGFQNLSFPKVKTASFGIKPLAFLGPNFWNSLPSEIKFSKQINAHVKLAINNFQDKSQNLLHVFAY